MEHARRLALGQWFTPPDVARIALALASSPGARRVLDPTCGDGVFLHAARSAGLDQLCGVELDPAAAASCRARVPEAEVLGGDLFEIELPAGSFDAVVGNPPYVRQERLTAAQKQRVRQRLRDDWPELPDALLDRLVGRGDLAAAVIARALHLVRPGGRVAFVVSSALLDAGYAAALWELVARVGAVRAVIDAPHERWFADAAINPVIIVIERGAAPGPVAIARLQCTTARAAERVRSLEDLPAVAELRWVSSSATEQWAAAVRADAAWYELVAAAGSLLVPLGSIAEVRRGLTSGANEVFYLDRARARELGLEPSVLQPLVRAPRKRGAVRIAIDPHELDDLVLCAPAELDGQPATRRYLERHAAQAERSMLRTRTPWWAVPAHPARLFLTKAYAARFVQRLAKAPVMADQRVYTVEPAAGVDVEVLAAVLNSTYTAFALESLGRASMGEGALEWTVGDAATLPVIDPRGLDAAAVRAALAALSRRSIGTAASERTQPDRHALDTAVGAGLDPALLARIHDALIASVTRRAARARATP
jgi:SAM-dependent methyltransferase